MSGNQLKYYTVEIDDKYYQSRNRFTSALHDAAHMPQELAERICRRYPGTTVEANTGYDVHFKMSLADVGEPEANVALSSAVKLAARDGMSLATILVQTEKAFHENGNAKI